MNCVIKVLRGYSDCYHADESACDCQARSAVSEAPTANRREDADKEVHCCRHDENLPCFYARVIYGHQCFQMAHQRPPQNIAGDNEDAWNTKEQCDRAEPAPATDANLRVRFRVSENGWRFRHSAQARLFDVAIACIIAQR